MNVICISKIAENNLRDYLRSENDKIITIQNGIDIDTFSKAQPLSRNNDKQIIAMVAGFRKEKDQDTLIKALNFLPKRPCYLSTCVIFQACWIECL